VEGPGGEAEKSEHGDRKGTGNEWDYGGKRRGRKAKGGEISDLDESDVGCTEAIGTSRGGGEGKTINLSGTVAINQVGAGGEKTKKKIGKAHPGKT